MLIDRRKKRVMKDGGFVNRTGRLPVRDILRRCACLRAAVVLLALVCVGVAAQHSDTEPPAASVPTSLGDTASVTANVPDTAVNADSSVVALSDSLAVMDSIAAAARSSGLTDTVFYESDVVDYDNEDRMLYLYGNARVKYQNITLDADTIVYDVDNSQFQARGRPQLIEGRDTTVGDAMVYNVKTRRGRVSYSTVRFDDTYFTGANIMKTEENCIYIQSGDYTTCENPNHPHYFFYGEQIKVVPQDIAVGRPVVLNIADAPVAVLPFFMMPLQRGRRSGWLTPSWGGSFASGGYLDNVGYYYAPNDYCDFTLSAKVQEFSNVVLNAGGRYSLRYKLDGSVSARYALDDRLAGASSQQWGLDYRHNQNLTPDGSTTLRGSGSMISNRSFNQLYSDETSVLEQQQLDANMALSHRFARINATSNIIWRRNHNLTTDRIQEDMPSVDFNLHNRAFLPYDASRATEPSWYNNIYYSYNARANLRRDVYGNDSLPGFTRPGMENNVNVNSSQKLFKYFDVSPYFNMRSSFFYGAIDTLVKDSSLVRDSLVYRTRDPYGDIRAPDYTLRSVSVSEEFVNDQGDPDTIYTVVWESQERWKFVRDTFPDEFNTVTSWNAGVNLSTRIYGLFPVNMFGITAVRHTMTPTIGYAYVPKHELDRTFYDVRINYDRPRPKAQQLMNISLANSFQGKRMVRDARTDNKTATTATGASGAGGRNVNDNFAGIDNALTGGDSLTVSDSLATGDSAGVNGTGTPGRSGTALREEKFDILSASISTAYDFEADSLKWRDLSLTASTSLNILRVNASANFWMYDERRNLTTPIMRDYNINLTSGSLGLSGSFWDGDMLTLDTAYFAGPRSPQINSPSGEQGWNISFSPGFSYRARRDTPSERFTPTKSFNLSSSASLRVTDALSVKWNGNYDFQSNQFSHNNYTFYYDLECWEMRFTWRPEKINPGFHFVVNVKKLPDFKWENKESRTTTTTGAWSGGYY